THDTRVGESKEEVLVTKPVIVRPILPNFIRTGDKAELSSLVYNFTDTSSEFTAMCRYEGELSENRFELQPGEFEQVLFSSVSPENENLMAEISCEATAIGS